MMNSLRESSEKEAGGISIYRQFDSFVGLSIWGRLLKARLALTIVNYHRNIQVSKVSANHASKNRPQVFA